MDVFRLGFAEIGGAYSVRLFHGAVIPLKGALVTPISIEPRSGGVVIVAYRGSFSTFYGAYCPAGPWPNCTVIADFPATQISAAGDPVELRSVPDAIAEACPAALVDAGQVFLITSTSLGLALAVGTACARICRRWRKPTITHTTDGTSMLRSPLRDEGPNALS
jgi:hypothetical protein